ncbi:transcription elongation factor GreB [Methylotenera sp.]|uniref:transcription elongation factor GreB n=1 Tax=Methylotenera sp. TaxID=2051956 RepID=UPI0024887785|nr:transcription elongation factor GreB [Methylotenera sp.]MDI1362373.1 transcription elongation factor GreB [Methylotenera sp.]
MQKKTVSDEKNYITPEGHAAIEAEFTELLKVERPALVKVVSWAAGNGDRSENGDYIYGKRRLRQIDSRLRFLMQRMDLAVIVDPAAQQGLEKVFFGAWVTLFSLKDDTEHTYRIVGKDELQPSLGYISWISPLARALLGKQIGDIVKVSVPVGEEEYEIIDVQYNPPS